MGRKVALIIGNSQYEDAGLARLSAPDADVDALADVLRDASIGAFDTVESIVNQSFAHTRRAIARFFDERKRDDLLLLYFSGHGIRDEYGQLHLAVRDTERSLLAATAIEAAFVSECMDRSASKRLVLVLDCCHSGAFNYGAKAAQGASVGTAVAFEGTGRGRIVLTATDATQYAWEGDTIVGDATPSVFTRHVTDGLRTGAADLDGDGIITIDELYEYVYEQVLNDTAKQTPGKWAFGQQGDIVIARNPAAVAPTPGDVLAIRPNVPRRTEPERRSDGGSETAHPLRAAIEALLARARQPIGIAAILTAVAVIAIVAMSGLPRPAPEPVVNTPSAQQDVQLQPAPAATDSTPEVAPSIETAKPVPDAIPPNTGRGAAGGRAGGRPPAISTSPGVTTGVKGTPPGEVTASRPAETTAPRSTETSAPRSTETSAPPPTGEPADSRAVAAAAPPPIVPVVIAETQKIVDVLARYRQARSERDVDALKEIWPTAPVADLRKAYQNITAETVTVTNCTKPMVQNGAADVECDEKISSKFTTGGSGTRLMRTTFSFKRDNDRWLIAKVARRLL